MTRAQVDSAERTLSLGTWAITAGAILYSVLTVTPLVESVSPDGWGWTAPVLPLVVDSAVVIVIRLDSTVARLGGEAGVWPAILRWLTGVFTLALNVGWSALERHWVGVGVHAVAPALLIATGEAGLAYRRSITRALDRLDREHQQQLAREQADRDAREQRAREEHDRQRADDERREREAREHQQQLIREQADRDAQQQQ
ncbi:SpdB, partial [Streptomyces sp. NRRL S-495]